MRTYILKLAGMLSVVALLAMPQMASAAGTLAGSTIGNTATLTFSVGGSGQPPVTGTAPSFTVDRKVDVNVTRQTANPVNVLVPDSTNNIHVFRVTNLGNGPTTGIDPYGYFTFPAVTAAGQVLAAVDLYADVDGSGTVTAGDTYLTPTTAINIPSDGYADILMVGTATNPATLPGANGTTETYNLVAVASNAAGTAPLGASPAPTAGEDIVFTDAAGTAPGDTVNNGQHSASGDYTAATAVISMNKDAYSIVDPYSTPAQRAANGGQGYAIPGATVTYRLTITNGGTASASLTSVADTLVGSLAYAGTGSWEVRNATTNAIITPNTAFVAGDVTQVGQALTFNISNFLAPPNGTLGANEKLIIFFDTTIQ